jgi:hypothetical protein
MTSEPLSDPPSDEELIAVVMTWANGADSCTWDCPRKSGGYCVDGHAEAYNAREILRSRGYE